VTAMFNKFEIVTPIPI